MNILEEGLIRTQLHQQSAKLSLPAVFAALVAEQIACFPALRAHQRHAWHAFLAQLGAVAMQKMGQTELPNHESVWREWFLALTPGEAAQTAWSLVAPVDRPAFLQPVIPDGLAALKKTIATPDGIDMLVTSRNHDLKLATMAQAQPDDWLFALLTLQTMQGFLGAGNYGISRMNGGFASRAALGLAPSIGPGGHLKRDILRLLALRHEIVERGSFRQEGGIALAWLVPWDGTTAIKPEELDPYYIEICRRVRLVEANGEIIARAGSSKCARIEPTPGGVTGDPWAPVKIDKDGSAKVLTLDASGFTYRRMVDLIFGQNGLQPAPLQMVADTDATEGLVLIARGLVRGQGKTEGYHERIISLSRRVRHGRGASANAPIARMAQDRVQLAGEVQRRILKPALLALFQNGPDQIDYGHDSSGRKAAPFLAAFDRRVDGDFFPRLWTEAEAETETDQRAIRSEWIANLLKDVKEIVLTVDNAAPKSGYRRYRALSRALDVLASAPWRNEYLKPWLRQPLLLETQDVV